MASFTPNGLEHKGTIRILHSCGITKTICQHRGKERPPTCMLYVSPKLTVILYCSNTFHVQNRRSRIKLIISRQWEQSIKPSVGSSKCHALGDCTAGIPMRLKPALSLAEHATTPLLCSVTIPVPSTVFDSVSTPYLTEWLNKGVN